MIFDSQYGTVRYGHDPVGSLALAQYDSDGARELRMPDAVGNLFRTEDRSDREYGPAGQLLKSIDAKGNIHRYSYDAEGNLVSKVRNDQEYWLYCWAIDGTLKKVVRPDGSEVTFSYDPLGRRISKTYCGQTTRWVWDGNVPLHEWVEGELQHASPPIHPNISNDSQAIRREAELSAHVTRGPPQRGSREKTITWLFEPESFAPLAKLTGEDQYSITCDHLGTPIAMHNAEGAEVWSAQLGTWGDLRNQTKGNAQDCPFRWPGQYEDVETGLYYNRFRYYDPEAGQYVSQDPIGLAGGFAVYAYSADPLYWCDPLGLKSCAERQQAMVDKNVGYNVSPEEWFQNFSHLGRYGTFVTDKAAFIHALGHARPGKYTVGRTAGRGRVSGQQARTLERKLGLEPGGLRKGFRITRIEGIRDMSPRSPLEGNRFFLGPGKGLPGGGPEIVIDPVPTS